MNLNHEIAVSSGMSERDIEFFNPTARLLDGTIDFRKLNHRLETFDYSDTNTEDHGEEFRLLELAIKYNREQRASIQRDNNISINVNNSWRLNHDIYG